MDAEKATLGALMFDWSPIAEVVTYLQPDHFYSQQNQIIFQAFLSLFGQGITGDVLSVTNELTKHNLLDKPPILNIMQRLSWTVPQDVL